MARQSPNLAVRWLSALVAFGLAALSGCATPSLTVAPGLLPPPTVAQLQTHITCVMAEAMDDHIGRAITADTSKYGIDDYKLWRRLVDYRVLGTVNLTLFVTQSQGLNPSFNFITPLTSLGKPIEQVVESSNGANTVSNATANAFNYTLAVGFQLNGTQDHNFVLNYVVDLHRLYDQMYVVDPTKKQTLLEACRAADPANAKSWHDELKGDLALRDTIVTGLMAWDAAPYSPVTAGSG